MICRICLAESTNLISVCNCSGTCGGVHLICIQHWLDTSRATSCEICTVKYEHDSLRSTPPKQLWWQKRTILNIFLHIAVVLSGLVNGSTIVWGLKTPPSNYFFLHIFIYQLLFFLILMVAHKAKLDLEILGFIWLCTFAVSCVISLLLVDVTLTSTFIVGLFINVVSWSIIVFFTRNRQPNQTHPTTNPVIELDFWRRQISQRIDRFSKRCKNTLFNECLFIWVMSSIIVQEKRRVWNANYKRWIQNDPMFDFKYELCYSYVYKGVPGG